MKRYKLVINSLITIEGSYYEFSHFVREVVANVIIKPQMVSWLIDVAQELIANKDSLSEKVTFEINNFEFKATLIIS